MKASSSVATPRSANQRRGRAGGEHPARIHQGYAVAALRLVHEMGGDEDRHAVMARKIDQRLPEPVASERIDARGRLVEDQDLRLVHDRDREREALADAERQVERALVEIVLEAEIGGQLRDARLRLGGGEMKEMRVQLEILPHRELGIEREGLRHVADAVARAHVGAFQRLAEQQRLAFARRQQAGQHLHRRRLAAAVRPEEAEDLAALDGEVDAVDGGKIAEPAGQVARDDDRFAVDGGARGNDEP